MARFGRAAGFDWPTRNEGSGAAVIKVRPRGSESIQQMLKRFKLMESLSFDAPQRAGEQIRIDEQYVQERLGGIADDETLIRFGFHSLRDKK